MKDPPSGESDRNPPRPELPKIFLTPFCEAAKPSIVASDKIVRSFFTLEGQRGATQDELNAPRQGEYDEKVNESELETGFTRAQRMTAVKMSRGNKRNQSCRQ